MISKNAQRAGVVFIALICAPAAAETPNIVGVWECVTTTPQGQNKWNVEYREDGVAVAIILSDQKQPGGPRVESEMHTVGPWRLSDDRLIAEAVDFKIRLLRIDGQEASAAQVEQIEQSISPVTTAIDVVQLDDEAMVLESSEERTVCQRL